MNKTKETVWMNCITIIKDIVDWQHFKTWFEPIKPVELKNNVLTIEVPSQFFYEYIEAHYVSLIAKSLKRELGKEARLEYRILVDSGGTNNNGTILIPATNNISNAKNDLNFPLVIDTPIKNPFIIPGIKKVRIDPQLNPKYTFDNFIEGSCNRVARRAGLTIAQQPGTSSFNPMVIYSSVGLGKTHLSQAIGNQIKFLNPNSSVLYVSSEKFINQFQDHSKKNAINDFIHFYQLMDVLIIDDIHFFNKAEKTQDALFAIFNHLHQSGKQLILTSDKPPKDLEGLQERLLSRFRWGLSTDLQIPDFETKVAIIQLKLKNEGLDMPEEVIKYIAENINTNIRELEGILISLLAQSSLNKKNIDIELAKKILRNNLKQSTKEITIESIHKLVCEHLEIPYKKLLMNSRKREIVQARQIAMYFSKTLTKGTLKNIGDHFGGKDHTTVMHSCKSVQDLMETNQTFKENVLEINQKIIIASL